MDAQSLQQNIVKTSVLQSDLDHLSARVERLCEQIDVSLPLLQEINLRMHDDISRRASMERQVIDVVSKVKEISSIQISHSNTMKAHSEDILDLKELATNQKAMMNATKFWWRFVSGGVGFIILLAGAFYAYERHMYWRLENAIFDEKKKKQEYTRERYLIRNGVNHEK